MKRAQLVARADQHGVYIAATETNPAEYHQHKTITVHTPEQKPRPVKAISMAYISFVYGHGRYTPGGIDKYLEFRKSRINTCKPKENGYIRKDNGALQFVNAVMHLMSAGPSHGANGNHLHRFRHVGS